MHGDFVMDLVHSGFTPMSATSESFMRHASGSSRQRSVNDPTVVGEQTCTFLRSAHPRATADNVAADLKAWRIKSATIAKMLERRSTPSTHLWIALTCVYGPEFLCAVLDTPPTWLDAACRAGRQQELEQRAAAIRAELESLR